MSSGDYLCRDKEIDLGWESVTVTMNEFDKLKKENEQLQKENEQLRQSNNQLEIDIEHTKRFYYDHMQDEKELYSARIEQLRQALAKCNNERIWCYSCNASMGNLIYGEKHEDDCEYIKLTKG